MRGGDAARALLAALGVVKKVDILDRSGFDDAARRLALHLLAEIEGPTNALAKRLEDELGVNWGKLSPAKREAAIRPKPTHWSLGIPKFCWPARDPENPENPAIDWRKGLKEEWNKLFTEPWAQ